MFFDNLFKKLGTLPVATIADDVTLSVISNVVTTLSSATGSGKTLYQTAHLAEVLDVPVYVLVPRRFLAVNAAETVAELAGCKVGEEVGYAVGSQTGDRANWGPNTKLVFATYGFALANELIQKGVAFVLDEVHETTMDLSIVRALLHRRLIQGDSLYLLEMSATMDTARQAAYWSNVAKTKIFEVEGKTFDCDVRHRPASKIEDEVLALLHEGRKGILAFRPGVGEVNDTAEEISKLINAHGLNAEVAKIYGEMTYEERKQATATPQNGAAKVLVGTNVVESGANIPWIDSGVSCGTGKEKSVREYTDAIFLELIQLPRWRLTQQEGRVKRFSDGVFVLCSPVAFKQREQASRPEIERLALTELVMHCAGFGLRAHELQFDHALNPEKVCAAELKLQRLGLIDKECMLTDAGKWITGLPVGPETGAMLWHANQLNCLGAMLPLAAIIEVGGVRKNFRDGHYFDDTSHLLDGLTAFNGAYVLSSKERRDYLERYNVGYKRFEAASDLLRDLERRFNMPPDKLYHGSANELRQCILAGSLDKLFVGSGGFRGGVRPVKDRYLEYSIGQGSAVRQGSQALWTGDLRVITPRDKTKRPFTVLEKITTFELDDLYAVAKLRPDILAKEETRGERFLGRGVDYTTLKLFGEYVLDQTADRVDDPYGDDGDSDFGSDRYPSFYARSGSRW